MNAKFSLWAAVFMLFQATAFSAPELQIENNQPFRVHMPMRIPEPLGLDPTQESWPSAQRDGDELIVVGNVAGHSSGEIGLDDPESTSASHLVVTPDENGVNLKFNNQDLGDLEWGLHLSPKPRDQFAPASINESSAATNSKKPSNGKKAKAPAGDPIPYQPDLVTDFEVLPLQFKPIKSGSLFTRYEAQTTTGGLRFSVQMDAYPSGYVDFHNRLLNQDAPTSQGVYCAVVTRWKHPEITRRNLCYDSLVSVFEGTTETTFRRGDGHHLALERGVDWIRSAFGRNQVVWLNDFSESFNVFVPAHGKSPGKWLSGNQPQLGEEAQSTPDAFYHITEISRGNIRRYRDRFVPYTLPMKGDSAKFASRMVFRAAKVTDRRADQEFVGYTSYRTTETLGNLSTLHIGVPYVVFGTSYFPYSTLGENFGSVKLPGQDREGYWPLSADTVEQWPLFADDIRRDLRIAKWMGFEHIRLHHLELLHDLPTTVTTPYLDFLFDQLRRLGMQATIDVQLTPKETANLVRRYVDAICGVEVENEVLIWGITENRQKYWNAVYKAVKSVAPDMPVHLTSHSNVGVFNELKALGGHTDKIGFHSYVDGVDAIRSGRDMALAVGNYAGEVGLPPIITEWNWRFMTKMPYDKRAKLYPQIMGNALITRSIPEFQQFQFTESLAMNPKLLGAIRHYEPLFLSRRPKPELLELRALIERYASPQAPEQVLDSLRTTVDLDSSGKGTAPMIVTNRTSDTLQLHATIEAPDDMDLYFDDSGTSQTDIQVSGGAEVGVDVKIEACPPEPGYYHFFVRLDGDHGFIRYMWGTAVRAGLPRIDALTSSSVHYPDGVAPVFHLDYDLPGVVVYGANASNEEIEYAIMIENTFEAATGVPMDLASETDYRKRASVNDNVLLVGTADSNAMLAETLDVLDTPTTAGPRVFRKRIKGQDRIVITGGNVAEVDDAAVDFILRYWGFAHDSAARKIGSLEEKDLPKGSDPTKLP